MESAEVKDIKVETPTTTPATLVENMEKPEPIIKVEQMNVIYFMGKSNQVDALKEVNLEIFPGEFIIFFGPSGCGKSTLLYSISGLEEHARGKILVGGINIANAKNRELEKFHQKKIGMIFQAYYLINSLTVLQNVILPQIAIGGRKGERIKKAKELLGHFGVSAQSGKLPSELSGGQQQRVAICRSLINDPEILLADEPVGNLDSKSSEDVMKLLKSLNEQQKKTVILVTHNPTHLSMAHRVFYMKDGAIVKVEVNSAINKVIEQQKEQGEDLWVKIPKEIELLARTYSSISPELLGTLLMPFKAKQIVSEVLTGLTSEEITKIENKIERILTLSLGRGIGNFEYLIEDMERFLDQNIEKGGMAFDKRKAHSIAYKIRDIVSEVRAIQEEEKKIASIGPMAHIEADNETAQLRHYLLDEYGKHLKSLVSLENMNRAIRDRLDNKIDRVGFEKILDTKEEAGGVGLDVRTARKLSKRMELLILGKYQ